MLHQHVDMIWRPTKGPTNKLGRTLGIPPPTQLASSKPLLTPEAPPLKSMSVFAGVAL